MLTMPDIEDIPYGQHVAIYGYGQYGKTLESLLNSRRSDITIDFIIDDKAADTLGSSPKKISLDTYAADYASELVMILLGVTDRSLVDKMAKALNSRQLEYVIIENLGKYLPIELTLFRALRESFKKQIEQTFEMLHTEADRRLYDALLAYRTPSDDRYSKEFTSEIARPWNLQYTDYINPAAIKTAVDGGVHEGKTTANMITHLYHKSPLEALYGFEPLIEVYERSCFKAELEEKLPIKLCSVGLWNKEDTLYFKESGTSSRITDEMGGEKIRTIKTVALDDYAKDNNISKIDFIKLDIEGAEIEALKGAEEIIRRDRPQMAISIYHLREHLFQIPLYIKELCPDYVFRLGHYSKMFNETILYAIPRELYNEQ